MRILHGCAATALVYKGRVIPHPFRTLFVAGAALLASGLTAAERPLREVIDSAFAQSAEQYRFMLKQLGDEKAIPRTFEHGKLFKPNLERDWTVGFFPGTLWYLFEGTGGAEWRTAAERYTPYVESWKNNKGTHDVGFVLYCSYGNGLRLTKNPAYAEVLQQGAATLAGRFSPTVGAIKSWDWGARKGWDFPVIVDNMMNLELLMWASAKDPKLAEVAIKHADTTLKHHFRDDHSSFHVVDYDSKTGAVLHRVTHQGTSDSSAWARGQGWGLYGYTLMYRFTKEPRYLKQAENIAAFIMNHPRLPADKIPYWDFDAPGIPNAPRDSSAGALIASALYELSDYVAPADAARYRAFADAQVRALASPEYLAKPGENGGFILKRATGNLPANGEIDVPINYADYYFLEALLRARAHLAKQP
jgi:uncharacterized protein YyaL (SSP411 family)